MTYYFCIDDLLKTLGGNGDQTEQKIALTPVARTFPSNRCPKDDVFLLTSDPKIIDLGQDESIEKLAAFIEDVPLYRINIELALDEALKDRHRNSVIERGLQEAFGDVPLPVETDESTAKDPEDISGGLRHAMLSHLDNEKLCRLYCQFLQNLEPPQSLYSFRENVLGRQAARFLKQYDGFVCGNIAEIKSDILLAFGQRYDHAPHETNGSYIESGKQKAEKADISDPKEILWAWLEADEYQMRRCHDLDGVLRLENIPKLPRWVQSDVFGVLEKEAMKQVFAQMMSDTEACQALVENTPKLKKAIERARQGEVDDRLQQLLSQTLNQGQAYSGSARQFEAKARARQQEARRARIL